MTRPFVVRLPPSAERHPKSLRHRAGLFGLAAVLGILLAGAASAQTLETVPALPGKADKLKPGAIWLPQGPGPTTDGQVEGIEDSEVVGAIHTVAAHPHASNKLFVGTVNGGIWGTTNATSQNVKWERLTDDQASNSIGALELDPTDPSSKTLVAGIGRYSSLSTLGGALTGMLRTTDSGRNWTPIPAMATRNISGVAARGNVLVASVDFGEPYAFTNIGIWRSTDAGATFQQISTGIGTATGLPGGTSFDLVGDPNNPNRLYTNIVFADLIGGKNGIYRSDNIGATWTKVSSPAMDVLINSNTTSSIEMAVGRHNNVYVAIANNGRLAGLFRSGDGGATWTALDLPATNEGVLIGIHPGGQAFFHLSLAADPTDPNLVYVGGDRQPLFREGTGQRTSFPNSIGAANFTGRIFRGDASKPSGSQWAHITHSPTATAPDGGTASNSAPHADSRQMAFDAAGNLLETDDGGIYRRTSPRSNTGDWFSLNGDLQNTEVHNVAYDSNTNIVFGGTQDTGAPTQAETGETPWETLLQGDGGDVAVDDLSTPGTSIRYISNQNLGNFFRTFWNSDNELVAATRPALLVVGGGATPVRQFYTPIAVNSVDGSRLVIGFSNAVYESMDRGDTIVEIARGVRTNGTINDPIAYGAGNNPDALYVGFGARVFIRTAPHPAPLTASATFPGVGTVTDLVIDPDDANTAFVVNASNIYRTTNAGATWTTLTGNLPSFAPGALKSVTYASTLLGDAVILGTNKGVFFATEASGFAAWQRLGNGMPTVPVYDLDYDRQDDVLVAGTLGRGTWKLPAFSTAVLGGN
ncbi:MAG TPA: RTX toxin [Thermoanaerobaculia bacterium]|nr:RTX toxin [Thermoanaerobaculia bacterium]